MDSSERKLKELQLLFFAFFAKNNIIDFINTASYGQLNKIIPESYTDNSDTTRWLKSKLSPTLKAMNIDLATVRS